MRHVLGCCTVFVVLMYFCSVSWATELKVRVTDPTGVGIPKILVIVMSFEPGKGEVARELSDHHGLIPALDLSPGLYEVIVTYPHGYWFTQVRDFAVGVTPQQVELQLDGAVIQQVPTVYATLHVEVMDGLGHPVRGAWVVGRKPTAPCFDFAKTDSEGKATVKIPPDSAEVTTIHNGQAHVETVEVKTQLIGCYIKCGEKQMKRLRKGSYKLTVRLP